MGSGKGESRLRWKSEHTRDLQFSLTLQKRGVRFDEFLSLCGGKRMSVSTMSTLGWKGKSEHSHF